MTRPKHPRDWKEPCIHESDLPDDVGKVPSRFVLGFDVFVTKDGKRAFSNGQPSRSGHPEYFKELSVSPRSASNPYNNVNINVTENGITTRSNVNMARLVLLAFVGPPPFANAKAHHKNFDTLDDRLENLEWKKQKALSRKSAKLGRANIPTSSVLNENRARAIRQLLEVANVTTIARAVGVKRRVIEAIANGKTWDSANKWKDDESPG